MDLTTLGLWADEEKRIQSCLIAALKELINQKIAKVEDGELGVSGKLRPLLIIHSRKLDGWTFHSEASIFAEETDEKPIGHPDFQFSRRDYQTGDQFDYDVECKLVRVKRRGKGRNYCEHYVTDGVVDRFVNGKYGQILPLGTMIGYIQEGEPPKLLSLVNKIAKKAKVQTLRKNGVWQTEGVTCLTHILDRKTLKFRLTHLWADLRY